MNHDGEGRDTRWAVTSPVTDEMHGEIGSVTPPDGEMQPVNGEARIFFVKE